MNEIHRPQECINANCVSMCSIAQYEGFKHWFGNNPEKCPSYKKGGPINVIDELENIKAEILDKVSMYENDFLIEPHFVEEVINKRISELKGDNK